LRETIPTVFQQNVSPDRYKVIIVNNNSTDNTLVILNDLIKLYNNLSIITDSKQGLGHAKNTGMNAATTEWIIYLDDDAKVPNDFVKKALININNSQYDCFGGVYLPWYKYGRPNWFLDKYASNAGKLSEFSTLKKDYLAGGIMAIKKSVLNNFNGFPTNLGMSGDQIAYGEETSLQIRMRSAGIKIGYDPNWIMYHLVNRYKLSIWWFIKSGFASGRGAWLTYGERVSFRKILIYGIRSIKLIFMNILKYTPKLLEKDYKWQNWSIDILTPTIIIFGRIYGGMKHILK